jgi:hypothetical protein
MQNSIGIVHRNVECRQAYERGQLGQVMARLAPGVELLPQIWQRNLDESIADFNWVPPTFECRPRRDQ